MCVIMLVTAEDKRPNDVMIEKAWAQNPDGGGIAWKERNNKGQPVVKWKKGLGEEEWGELIRTLPTPFVAHARIASAEGGSVCDELTHPFPIDDGISLALEGTSKLGVLFHNGNWKEWAGEVRQALYGKGVLIPAGRWNDTRAMAWLTSLYGDGFMEFLPSQRGILLKPIGWEIFSGPGWKEINGVWCSNDLFIHRQRNSGGGNTSMVGPIHVLGHHGPGGFCRVVSCNRRDTDEKGYCPLHILPTLSGAGPKVNVDLTKPAVILAPDGTPTGTTGVSPASPNPFRAAATRVLYNRSLTELTFKRGHMSKNLYKQLIVAHDWIDEPEGSKKREKGLKVIRALAESKHLEDRMKGFSQTSLS